MRALKNPWIQLVVVVALGVGVGLWYREHRAARTAWASTHYRLDETIGFPLSQGIPFGQQYLLDAAGERIAMPLEEGQELELDGATWWSVDESGRMRIWNEERVEVFPTLIER